VGGVQWQLRKRINAIGNQITGNVQTSKSVLNIESMTIQVWVSEIESDIFGKDSWRQVTRMRGLPDKADAMAATLKSLGEAKGMIGSAISSLGTRQTDPLLKHQVPAQKTAQGVFRCKSCKSEIEHGSRFCGVCDASISPQLSATAE